jgi:hypothetical protein
MRFVRFVFVHSTKQISLHDALQSTTKRLKRGLELCSPVKVMLNVLFVPPYFFLKRNELLQLFQLMFDVLTVALNSVINAGQFLSISHQIAKQIIQDVIYVSFVEDLQFLTKCASNAKIFGIWNFVVKYLNVVIVVWA